MILACGILALLRSVMGGEFGVVQGWHLTVRSAGWLIGPGSLLFRLCPVLLARRMIPLPRVRRRPAGRMSLTCVLCVPRFRRRPLHRRRRQLRRVRHGQRLRLRRTRVRKALAPRARLGISWTRTPRVGQAQRLPPEVALLSRQAQPLGRQAAPLRKSARRLRNQRGFKGVDKR